MGDTFGGGGGVTRGGVVGVGALHVVGVVWGMADVRLIESLSIQVLWEGERYQLGQERKQTFVDLGCGNGLLVYILSSEGVGRERVWGCLLHCCTYFPCSFPIASW